MPTGELAALLSALTFSATAIVEKSLTRRFKPLALGALSTLGGTVFAVILMLSTGRADDLSEAPVWHLLLSVAGGVIAIGLGMPLYLVFLRSVDISKASPLNNGLFSLLAVVSGLVLLGEEFSLPTLLGIGTVISGVYLLSLSQRRQADTAQARWLGFRGLAFLVLVVSFWVVGSSIQKVAVEKVDVIVANAVRLGAVFLVLAPLALANVDALLGRQRLPFGRGGDEEEREKGKKRLGSIRPGAPVRQERIGNPLGNIVTLEAGRKSSERPSRLLVAAAIVNGCFTFGIASLLTLVALKEAGLAVSAVLGTTQLLWIALLSAIVLRERLSLKTVIGMILTASGVVVVVI